MMIAMEINNLVPLGALAVVIVIGLVVAHSLVSKRWPQYTNRGMVVWFLLAAFGVFSILRGVTGW